MIVASRMSLMEQRAYMIKVGFLYLILSVFFPGCALGVESGVDDDEQIMSILAYGFTPADVLISAEHPGRQQKMEDFILGMSLGTKRIQVQRLLERELGERPLSDILKYVEHHDLNAAAGMLNKYSSAGTMSGVMYKCYGEGGVDGVLQYIGGLFDLTEDERLEAGDVSKGWIKDMDYIDDWTVEMTLRAILIRLVGICEAHHIAPKLASQKGVVNKTVDVLTSGFSKMLITTGSALCAIGASEYLVGSLGTAAEYLLHYKGHSTTCPEIDDCLYYECDGGREVNIANAGNLPECIMVKTPPSYESEDMCIIPVDMDDNVRNFQRITASGNGASSFSPVKIGEGGKRYTTILAIDAEKKTLVYRGMYSAMIGGMVVLGGATLLTAGFATYYYKKSRAMQRRLDASGELGGALVSLLDTKSTVTHRDVVAKSENSRDEWRPTPSTSQHQDQASCSNYQAGRQQQRDCDLSAPSDFPMGQVAQQGDYSGKGGDSHNV